MTTVWCFPWPAACTCSSHHAPRTLPTVPCPPTFDVPPYCVPTVSADPTCTVTAPRRIGVVLCMPTLLRDKCGHFHIAPLRPCPCSRLRLGPYVLPVSPLSCPRDAPGLFIAAAGAPCDRCAATRRVHACVLPACCTRRRRGFWQCGSLAQLQCIHMSVLPPNFQWPGQLLHRLHDIKIHGR